ncbi:hypothetical protein Dimus_007306 [Dionaea muscipula]
MLIMAWQNQLFFPHQFCRNKSPANWTTGMSVEPLIYTSTMEYVLAQTQLPNLFSIRKPRNADRTLILSTAGNCIPFCHYHLSSSYDIHLLHPHLLNDLHRWQPARWLGRLPYCWAFLEIEGVDVD